MLLSKESTLALELCRRLGIPFEYGSGYAKLQGIPINKMEYDPPFHSNGFAEYEIYKDIVRSNNSGLYSCSYDINNGVADANLRKINIAAKSLNPISYNTIDDPSPFVGAA